MKLSDLILMAKLQVPSLKDAGLTDDQLTTLINNGCNEANLIAKVYKGYTDFNIVQDTFIYNLSTICPNFLGADKKGLWIKDGSGNWQRITPKTEDWINKRFENWRDAYSGDLPEYCWTEGDELGIYPPVDEDRSLSGRLYHLKKAGLMGSGDHYPYSGSDVEITALLPMDDAIIAYVRWKTDPSLGNSKDVITSYSEFISMCKKAAIQIKRRPDMTHDNEYYMDFRRER